MGTGVPPWGPPPHPGIAVYSDGSTALHWAAAHGNGRIVRSLIAANADIDAQDEFGCAVPIRHRWVGGRVAARLPCRDTPLHWAASHGGSDAVAELLMRFADFTIKRNGG